MKLSQIALAVTFALSASAHAAVYKCEEGGQIVFSDRPCGQTAEKVKIRTENKSSEVEFTEWRVKRFEDDMTETAGCTLVSPLMLLGIESGEMKFATLRVATDDNGYVVAVRSESGISDRPESIHNNIDGLGLKVGDFPFHEFQIQSGSYVVGFKPGLSSQIVQELQEAGSFRVRLRYWPYDETHDSPGTDTEGFGQALKDLKACEKEG